MQWKTARRFGRSGLALAGLALFPLACPAQAQERQDAASVPLLQATDGDPACPAPQPPQPSPESVRAESHYRAERGNSCYQAGRCRLPNAYLYDAEIVPRVKKALLADGGFDQTSIWVEGRRRWVWLRGCVPSRAQAQAAEQLVRSIDDVEAVINELRIHGP